MPKNTSTPHGTARPWGRTLSDLWLDGEEGKLHPAEWQLLECAARGEALLLGPDRPPHVTEKNRIRSEVLRFVALGGDAHNPLHEYGLKLRGAWIETTENKLDFEGTKLPRNFVLKKCTVDGDIVLHNATAKTVVFSNCAARGLYAERAELSGRLSLNGRSRFSQTVSLKGAKIGGQLELDGCRLLARETALDCQDAKIGDGVYLTDGFRARGVIDFTETTIGGSFVATNCFLLNADKSLFAPRCSVASGVNIGQRFRARGLVSFQGAFVDGDLTCTGGIFQGKPCINLRNVEVTGTLFWQDITEAQGELNLSAASCRTLNTSWSSWEKPEQIRLDNFVYKGFSQLEKGANAAYWRRFLERQPENHLNERFRPNPYSQLADVLQSMGHEQEAVSVRVEQRRRQSQFTRLHEPKSDRFVGRIMRHLVVFWNFMQGLVVDYGYRPGKALFFLFGIVAVGTVIYHFAARDGIMTPTHPLIFKEAGNLFPKECTENWVYFPKAVADECAAGVPSEYSEFSSLIYSLDTALPIVNFRMEDDWSPRVVTTSGERYWPGWWVRTWEWVQIALGWLLSLLFASAIGGIIRR